MGLIENLLPPRFEIIRELGRGGTSVVLQVRDANRDRQEVAVKILLKDSEEDRFQREAERLSSLSHPNVVSFLEVGRYEDRDFLVMEYLAMGDLTSYTSGLGITRILRLFIEICDGLAHLHDRGIVHRDLKPANILVAKDGRPKITDLGVARQMERNTRLTQAGTILGTYSYLAPEQILSSTVGPRADLYSLGICLFTALTGRKPFEAENEFKMLKAHLEEPPPSLTLFLPGIPKELDDLVQALLAKDEQDRPRSARVVADLLSEVVEIYEKREMSGEPDWENLVEKLPEEQRSVLLAITYLGREATFERVCQASPFAEDKTDRCLEALMENRLIDSPTEDRFSLRVPEDTVATRLTPRLKKLFSQRLTALAGSAELSEETPLENREKVSSEAESLPTQAPLTVVVEEEEEDTLVGDTDDLVDALGGTSFTEPPKEPTEAVVSPPAKPTSTSVSSKSDPAPGPPQEPTSKPESASGKSKWLPISLLMLFLGVVLAGGGQWFYSHSASLQISTTPPGAQVEVNGLERGETPLLVSRLTPGRQAVEITLDGHRPLHEKVELGFFQRGELHYTLDPRVGKLFLTLNPRDASVTIDDQVYGIVKSDLTLAPGSHKLTVNEKGFEPYTSQIIIEEGKALELEVTMTPISATVEVTSTPPGASVTLTGQKEGKTPVKFEKVPYGKHEIAVRLKGHDRVHQTIEVTSNKKLEFHTDLKELPGALSITSVPKGAKVKLNGQVKGETPLNLTGLKAGTYTLSLSKDGYHPLEEKRTVKAGEETKTNLALDLKVVAPPPVPSGGGGSGANGGGGYQPPPVEYRPPPPAQQPSRPPSGNNPWIVE